MNLKVLSNIFFTKKFSECILKYKNVFSQNKNKIFLLIILSLASVTLDFSTALILGKLISSEPTVFLGIIPLNNVFISLIIILVFQLSREYFNFLNVYVPGKTAISIEKNIKERLIKKTLYAPRSEINLENKNNLVLKIHNHSIVYALFFSDVVKLIINIIIFFSYLLVLTIYDFRLFLIIFLVFIIVISVTNKIITIQELIGVKSNLLSKKYHDLLSDSIFGLNEIISKKLKKSFVYKNFMIVKNQLKFRKRALFFKSILAPIQRSTGIILFCFIFFLIEIANKDGVFNYSSTSIIIFFFTFFRIQTPLSEINTLRSSLLAKLDVVNDIFNIMNFKNSNEKTKYNSCEVNLKKSTISFKNISFKYERQKTLNNISLTIKPNEITSIVGPSGSGKTTIINLLLKMYKPSSGKILVNDKSINTINDEDWLQKISVISQNGYIFNDTILRNITMFNNNVNNTRLYKIVKDLGLHSFVNSLPKKYNTIIGGKEIPLSGGQQQKIRIARALVSNPEILILDEATSNQDAISEDKIMKTIRKYYPKITIIIIAHRFFTLKQTDFIYYIENGRIVEKGKWDILKKNKGYFMKMLEPQNL